MNKRLLPIASAMLMVACAGGQSGNEGEMPAAPCAGVGSLLQATVVSAAAGCVELEVLRVVKEGPEVYDGSGKELFSGRAEPGERLTGKLGVTYSLVTGFSRGDVVAALPSTWGDLLEFQLMPSEGDSIEGRWGANTFTASFADIASPRCAAILEERLRPRESSSETGTQQTEAQPIPNCVE